MQKKTQAKRNKAIHNLVTKEREGGWYIPPIPSAGIPYDAEKDKYCPQAKMKRFNSQQKTQAQIHAEKGRGSSDWLKSAIQSNFKDVPLKINPNFRAKAMSVNGLTGFNQDSMAEVDILQKVVVRENFLAELRKLIENQNEIGSCLNEIGELIKAIRFQTVDIVESIDAWQVMQASPLPFLYRGVNYLLKIATDLDYLDEYDEIVEKFCFEFRFNPLAFRGGGDIITGYPSQRLQFHQHGKSKSDSTARTYLTTDMFIDGVEVFRLRNAENTIQREFDRVDAVEKQRAANGNGNGGGTVLPGSVPLMSSHSFSPGGETTGAAGFNMSSSLSQLELSSQHQHQHQQQQLRHPQLEPIHNNSTHNGQTNRASADSIGGGGGSVSEANNAGNKNSKKPNRTNAQTKWKLKFNSKRVKQERIAALTEEADELRAVETHIEDKIATMVQTHIEYSAKRTALEKARREAIYLDRQTAANQLAVEVSVLSADMQNINAEVKELQRQIYFVSLERKRKRKIAKTLRDELEDENRRKKLEAELSKDIKKVGLMTALKNFSSQNSPLKSKLSKQKEDSDDSDDDEADYENEGDNNENGPNGYEEEENGDANGDDVENDFCQEPTKGLLEYEYSNKKSTVSKIVYLEGEEEEESAGGNNAIGVGEEDVHHGRDVLEFEENEEKNIGGEINASSPHDDNDILDLIKDSGTIDNNELKSNRTTNFIENLQRVAGEEEEEDEEEEENEEIDGINGEKKSNIVMNETAPSRSDVFHSKEGSNAMGNYDEELIIPSNSNYPFPAVRITGVDLDSIEEKYRALLRSYDSEPIDATSGSNSKLSLYDTDVDKILRETGEEMELNNANNEVNEENDEDLAANKYAFGEVVLPTRPHEAMDSDENSGFMGISEANNKITNDSSPLPSGVIEIDPASSLTREISDLHMQYSPFPEQIGKSPAYQRNISDLAKVMESNEPRSSTNVLASSAELFNNTTTSNSSSATPGSPLGVHLVSPPPELEQELEKEEEAGAGYLAKSSMVNDSAYKPEDHHTETNKNDGVIGDDDVDYGVKYVPTPSPELPAGSGFALVRSLQHQQQQ